MKKILLIVFLLLPKAQSMSYGPPTFEEMWHAAQLVVVCDGWEWDDWEELVDDLSNAHPNLEYFRSGLTLSFAGRYDLPECIIKGELRPNELEEWREESRYDLEVVRARYRYNRELSPGDGLFGYAPFFSDPPTDGRKVMLFLKRGLNGEWEPIDLTYCIYYIGRAIEYYPNHAIRSTETSSDE